MFKNLTDFSFQRNRKQAIGFYSFWLIAGSVITAMVVYAYIHFTSKEPLPRGMDLAAAISAFQALGTTMVPLVIGVFSVGMAVLIARAKGAFDRTSLVCFLLAAVLSFGGLIFSLIPVAYLTTRAKSSS